jgi:WD40 repeat protein
MTQFTKNQYFKPCVWILCLGILTACGGGVSLTSTSAPIPEASVSIGAEASPTPSVTATHAILPTHTNTPISTSVLTETPVPTLAPPEIISAENANKIVQIGKPFALKNLLAEFVFRAKATWLVTSDDGQQIEVYDLPTQKLITTLEDEVVLIERLVVSADGRLLAAVSPSTGKVILWNLDTFGKIEVFALNGYRSYPTLTPSPTGGEFSSDNLFLVIWGCRSPALNAQGLPSGCISSGVTIYDLQNSTIYQELNGLQSGTSQATFSQDSSMLILSGEGESFLQADLLVWDVMTKQQRTIVTTDYEYGLTGGKYSPDGTVFVAHAHGSLLFFETDSWQIITTQAPGINLLPSYYLFSKVEQILIAAEGISGISIRNPTNGDVYFILKMGVGSITNLALSPDGRLIYTISEDGFVRTWGIPSPP